MIYVITHKVFDDSIVDRQHYQIMHVGQNKECKEEYLRDDVGNNISHKNPNYCELTGLYWIWKNVQESADEITGLVHYRRYFTTHFSKAMGLVFDIPMKIVPYSKIESVLQKNEIILPVKWKDECNVMEYYAHYHLREDMELTRICVERTHPESVAAFDHVMRMNEFYIGNMMICKRKLLDQYCEWLFSIFELLESMIDLDKYEDAYQRRVFGFISERLLQVWVESMQLKVYEMPLYNTEQPHEPFLRKVLGYLHKRKSSDQQNGE